MFLSKILALSGTINHYIVIVNMFAVIACNLLLLQKYLKDVLSIALKLMASRRLKWIKKVKLLNSKNYKRKIKLSFIIYANFESFLIPENNGEKTPDDPYSNEHQSHAGFRVSYKLICVGDQVFKIIFR